MPRFLLALPLCFLLLLACTEKNVTNTYGPTDWQPPVISWLSPPEAELRGTVGLDVSIADSSTIDRVTLFVDGRENQSINQTPYRFELHSDSLLDGVHLCEVRASDQYGNLGISPVLRVYAANGFPEGIRLLWVPDSFATIQAAINAAQDDDTIRVRDGTYHETLNLFGKGIWLESEYGPLHCEINGDRTWAVIFVPASSDPAGIRGFRLTGGGQPLYLGDGSRIIITNNIAVGDSDGGLLISSYSSGAITNNLFTGSQYGLQISYHWGVLYNNIVQDVNGYALWNAALSRNPLLYGYSLLWQNLHDYNDRFEPGIGDVYADPMLDMESGRLLPGSPAIDSGNPDIMDRDGSRSDIGPFGGPYAY